MGLLEAIHEAEMELFRAVNTAGTNSMLVERREDDAVDVAAPGGLRRGFERAECRAAPGPMLTLVGTHAANPLKYS